jgi:hypothetical protein
LHNGELIAGGVFTTAGGMGANYVARWNGSIWQPLGGGMSSSVSALTVYNGGKRPADCTPARVTASCQRGHAAPPLSVRC